MILAEQEVRCNRPIILLVLLIAVKCPFSTHLLCNKTIRGNFTSGSVEVLLYSHIISLDINIVKRRKFFLQNCRIFCKNKKNVIFSNRISIDII